MPDPSTAVARTGFSALNTVVRPLLRRGLASPLPVGVGAVVLVTKGRRTGRRREIPLVTARVGDSLVVSTVRRSSQWVRNVEASPDVGVWLGGTKRRGVAEVRRGRGADVVVIRLSRVVDDQSAAARSRSSAA